MTEDKVVVIEHGKDGHIWFPTNVYAALTEPVCVAEWTPLPDNPDANKPKGIGLQAAMARGDNPTPLIPIEKDTKRKWDFKTNTLYVVNNPTEEATPDKI